MDRLGVFQTLRRYWTGALGGPVFCGFGPLGVELSQLSLVGTRNGYASSIVDKIAMSRVIGELGEPSGADGGFE